MNELTDLNERNLKQLSNITSVPEYDRSKVKAGIAHIGIGGFHRAHQAFYTDKLLQQTSEVKWGTCGICLLERDRKMYDVLVQQNGLYTLMHKQQETKPEAAIIGSIVEYFFAPENPQKVIEKMADPDIKIISLTITEGGYNFDEATGAFNWNEPSVLWDKLHPDAPETVFGYLTEVLKIRKEQGLPVTIQSCDNIQQNGDVAKTMLLTFINEAAPNLTDWINTHVSFPNSMVDRITPATTKEDIILLQESYGINDHWPVVSENFHQWIIEDTFIAGRPPWEDAGVQFVSDVHPYEKMKIRILNGGHSLTGLSGYLAGYQFIHEVTADPLFATFLKQNMDDEVTPILDPIPGVDIEQYKNTVIERFGNPYIKDRVERIILGSSAKIPKFILPTIIENLKIKGPIRKSTLVVACWYCYLEQMMVENHFDEVEDEQKDLLLENIRIARTADPFHFLEMKSVFGDLVSSNRFTTIFLEIVERIRESGIRKAIQWEMKFG